MNNLNGNKFLNNDFRKKTSVIYRNYNKNTTIENQVAVDFRNDPKFCISKFSSLELSCLIREVNYIY